MKILILAILIALPLTVSAALQVPTQTPLQPAPEGIGPNINSNINSGDSSFNESQQQVQDQLPGEENQPGPAAPVVVSSQSIAFYWALIIISGLILVGMFVYLYYRYQRND